MKPYVIKGIFQPGSDKYAERELIKFGVKNFTKNENFFEFVGHPKLLVKLNCKSRIFSGFEIKLMEGKARFAKDLQKLISQVKWSDFLTTQKIKIKADSFRSKLYHEGKIKEIVEKTLSGIYDNEATGNTEQKISVRIVENRGTISIDSSGEHLHKRGFAVLKEKAPLRETIASAMISEIYARDDIDHIIDPMCGSGTILSEALAMTYDLNIGKYRGFSFQNWASFPERNIHCFDEPSEKNNRKLKVTGFDIDVKSVLDSRENLSVFNESDYRIEKKDFFDISEIPDSSVILTNPPYGKRIMRTGDAVKIYKKLSDLASKGVKVGFLIPAAMKSKININVKPVFTFYNGNIKTDFLTFNL
ncbi:MAG: hypothetical protein CSB55_06415 [Candidatus Cloacimonadota bacterium]|nr:MAG: hypothetical protein CSB55_06415 [Candidatus Cloacimonadota bacterium]